MNQIRNFLLATLAAGALAACGGGGGGATASAAATGSPSASANAGNSTGTVTTQSATTAIAGSSTLATVTVVGSASATGTPDVVTFGQVFAQGEATGTIVATANGAVLPTQSDVKRRYADGSIRHALVSVQVSPSSGASIPLALSSGSGAAIGTPLTLDAVLAGSVDYAVEITEGGTLYRTTLKEALRGTTDTWMAGPLVTEWRARVAPHNGTVAHPGLRVIFDARFASVSQGRVSVTVENVESTAARGDRSYDLRILNASGTALFAQTGITHYYQTRYRKVYYFGGATGSQVIADIGTLERSRAIFQYTKANIGADLVSSLYSQWQGKARGLFDTGLINSGMPDGGGRPDIGPLPGWYVTALVSGDPRAYEVMYDTADRAGVFSIHYRDAQTGDINSIDQHPTLTLGSSGQWSAPADQLPASPLTGTTPHVADTAHQPALAYLPYVVSGDRFYLDELYFWANYNLISTTFDVRSREKGLVNSDQVRGQAWTLRTLGHAAWIAPDTDWQKNYFTDKVQQNINWFRSSAMPTNPLGWYRGTSDWDGSVALSPDGYMSSSVLNYTSPWMHDFLAMSFTQLCEQGFVATDIRNWLLGFTVKRFTSAPDFNPMDGTSYHLAALLKGNKLVKTMADLSLYSFAGRKTAAPTALPYTGDPGGYAIQALANLGVASDVGLTKAATAYKFVRDEIIKKGGLGAYLSDPTWNIEPRNAVSTVSGYAGLNPPAGTTELPITDNLPRNTDGSIKASWFAALPLNQWVEVPGSRLLDNIAVPAGFTDYDLMAVVYSWGGAALDTKRRGLHLFGGGHGDGKWNGLLFFSFDSYRWKMTWPGTPRAQILGKDGMWSTNVAGTDSLNADGNPMASHGWYGYTWIPERDELFLGIRRSVVWDLNQGQWRKPFVDWDHSHWANDMQAWSYKGKVYVMEAITQYGGWVFDPAATTTLADGTVAVGSYSAIPGFSGAYPTLWEQIAVAMPERGEVFRMRPQDHDHPPHVLTLDDFSRTYPVDPTGKGWADAFNTLPYVADNLSGAAFVAGATRADDRIYLLENGGTARMWVINPNDWSGSLMTTTGSKPAYSRTGYYGRFAYDQTHGVLMVIQSVLTADGSGTEVPNVKLMRIR